MTIKKLHITLNSQNINETKEKFEKRIVKQMEENFTISGKIYIDWGCQWMLTFGIVGESTDSTTFDVVADTIHHITHPNGGTFSCVDSNIC